MRQDIHQRRFTGTTVQREARVIFSIDSKRVAFKIAYLAPMIAHISPALTTPLTPLSRSLGPCTSLPKHSFILRFRAPCFAGACARRSYQDKVTGGFCRIGDNPGPMFCRNSGSSGLTKSPLFPEGIEASSRRPLGDIHWQPRCTQEVELSRMKNRGWRPFPSAYAHLVPPSDTIGWSRVGSNLGHLSPLSS